MLQFLIPAAAAAGVFLLSRRATPRSTPDLVDYPREGGGLVVYEQAPDGLVFLLESDAEKKVVSFSMSATNDRLQEVMDIYGLSVRS